MVTGNAAARTAVGPTAIVAIDQHEEVPLVRDKLACRLLPASGRVIAALTSLYPLRKWMIDVAERKMPGLWASMLCRKRYIDDQLRAAAGDGLDAVVVLGAGFDTRAHRLPFLDGTPFYEVDLPENIARKRAALQKLYGKVPDQVTLVPLDFESQDLAGALAERGWDAGQRTFFVWEAVTQYLTEVAVRRTFDFLETARTGSRLVFTYVRKDFLDGREMYGAEAAHREYVADSELWRFGWEPEEVAGFLAEYGWRQVEQVGPPQFAERYLVPNGRKLGASEVERSVLAEKA
ncbi:SAM-dependent methyltransferase [Saccharopolyspora sp. WRP15-2]|uniref:S-adenosyl-L-methionine-dependent methyltransferase n=1 Tax=Saccharopolyspora oryzae TaxID=2997343 RepID=A0ABT4USI8_9PSEU|nr:SAM-dependent methyltransferase [Saccharopolyspora oryzae]MDA3624047.1 SAM-dependent methyltransferase [Saccharopolyspora oryzae]